MWCGDNVPHEPLEIKTPVSLGVQS
jgi:hypothetical protein